MEEKGLKLVYAVVQRPHARTIWLRVGTGWANRDGSLNLQLDAIPVDGRLQVRDMVPARDVVRPLAVGDTKGETKK
jgi:hypothetical protein